MRDKPLNLSRVSDDALCLGISYGSFSYPVEAASIVQDLALAVAAGDAYRSYSRDRNHYAGRKQKCSALVYSYQRVTVTIDELECAGVVENAVQAPGSKQYSQSRVRLIDRFAALAAELLNLGRPAPRASLLELRDHKKKLIDFDFPHGMAQEMAWLRKYQIGLPLDFVGRVGNMVLLPNLDGGVSRRIFDLRAMEPYRVFSDCTISKGGRIYGLWVQNITKAERSLIKLAGECVVEVDFSNLHPRMLYAEIGLSLPKDPYLIPNIQRSVVKVAFNTLINASTFDSAIRSMLDCRDKPAGWPFRGCGSGEKVSQLLEFIVNSHPKIKSSFGSGAGLRLQRKDSER